MPSSFPIAPSNDVAPQRFRDGPAERFRSWRERRRWATELAAAAALGRLDSLLEDIAITRSELDALANGPADAGRQFEQWAAATHADLHQLDVAALREAFWVCARCACREPCKRWLRGQGWDANGDQRCPNAALLRH